MISGSFDSTKTLLHDILEKAECGKLQLPDFQRGWVWDDDRIRSLLASVSVSFPIGAIMLLETGGAGVRFKPRQLAGTSEQARNALPESLILDGQQRLTSLFQALMGNTSVETKDNKGKAIRRWYYLDMKKAIDNNDERDEALLSVPEDRRVKAFGGDVILDIATPEKEFANGLFPVNRVYQSAEWRQSYNRHWGYDADKIRLFDEFERQVVKRFEQYQVPVIELKKETPKEAVCLVFERVNTGGMPLSVFELLTAAFAADDFQLRDDWSARDRRMKQDHPVLRGLQSDDFLQAISLLVTQTRRRAAVKGGINPDQAPGISCKRKDILKLEVTDWKDWADRVEKGFTAAARFLFGQKIFKAADLPYRTQLVPLATIFADLGELSEAEGIRQKIAQWYWCGVLGEIYGSAIESRFARDLPEVTGMVRGEGIEPITIRESTFQAGRLLSLRTRNSAAYKGIYALLMRDGGRDFRTGEPIEAQTYFDDQIDIHHIFPEKWCSDAKISPDFYNSIINKTALSARTNRQIGGRAPSSYLLTLQKGASITPERMDEILSSHCIDPCLARVDNYWQFFASRAESLLKRIEAATGKAIPRENGLFAPGAKLENYDDGPQELEGSLPLESSPDNEGRQP